MSEAAAAQLRRILLLIPRLEDGGEHAYDDLASALSVDRSVVVRDVQTLTSRTDEPGGFVPGVQVYLTTETVSVVTSQFKRPMRLTASELGALELGLAMLRAECPPDERHSIDRALARLRKVLVTMPSDTVQVPVDPMGTTERVASLPAPSSTETLSLIQRGMADHHKLRIRYRAASSEHVSERIIRSYALMVASGSWYVLAWCESAEAIRSFRLERIEDASLLPEEYEVPATFSVDEHLTNGKVLRPGAETMLRVRFSPRIARWIAEREDVELAPDGSLTIDHPLADAHWGVRHALQYGQDAEVLQPAELRSEVAHRLRALVAVAADQRRTDGR